MWCAIVEDEICSELCVRVWSATEAGKGKIPWVPGLRRSELSTQIDKGTLVTLVCHAQVKESRGCSGQTHLVCVEDGGRETLLARIGILSASLSQPFKWDPITPHEVLELKERQAATYVGVS